MDRKVKDEILIRHYLLGELSQGEQEQLEQRLMTEGDCFHLAAVLEAELVDQYLYGHLSTDEQEKFARRFLTTPEGTEHLQLAANLKRYAHHQQAEAKRPFSADDVTAPGSHGFPRSRMLSSTARYALAATVILVVAILAGLGWRVGRLQNQIEQMRAGQGSSSWREQELQNQLAEQQSRNEELARSLQQEQAEHARLAQEVRRLSDSRSERPQPLIAAITLTSSRIRSGGPSRPLVIQSNVSQVLLHLLVREPAYTSYQASLQTDSGREIWAAGSLKPQTDRGRIHVRVSPPVQLLSGGDYQLRLQGRTETGAYENAGNYYFRVDKK
jgi:hypothetical protein